MSNVHRLCLSDRIFFVSASLRRALARFSDSEYALLGAAIAESRQQPGFLFLGYALLPDQWHALIWPAYPLTISRVIQHIKWVSSRSVNASRQTKGPLWQHQFWDRFVRHDELRYSVGKGHPDLPRAAAMRYHRNLAVSKGQPARLQIERPGVALDIGIVKRLRSNFETMCQ